MTAQDILDRHHTALDQTIADLHSQNRKLAAALRETTRLLESYADHDVQACKRARAALAQSQPLHRV